jgi:hypothetical protein
LEVGIEPSCPAIGIHVEGMLREAGYVWALELATKGEDQSIVAKRAWVSRRSELNAHLLPLNVDINHFSFDSLDANGFQHIVQSNPNGSQISLIVPNPDTMERISIDKGNCNVVGSHTQLI